MIVGPPSGRVNATDLELHRYARIPDLPGQWCSSDHGEGSEQSGLLRRWPNAVDPSGDRVRFCITTSTQAVDGINSSVPRAVDIADERLLPCSRRRYATCPRCCPIPWRPTQRRLRDWMAWARTLPVITDLVHTGKSTCPCHPSNRGPVVVCGESSSTREKYSQ